MWIDSKDDIMDDILDDTGEIEDDMIDDLRDRIIDDMIDDTTVDLQMIVMMMWYDVMIYEDDVWWTYSITCSDDMIQHVNTWGLKGLSMSLYLDTTNEETWQLNVWAKLFQTTWLTRVYRGYPLVI